MSRTRKSDNTQPTDQQPATDVAASEVTASAQPSEGGSYVRHPDGSLTRVEGPVEEVPVGAADVAADPEQAGDASDVRTDTDQAGEVSNAATADQQQD